MADYTVFYSGSDTRPWASLTDMITSVVIEDGVTGIGNMAFANCKNLTSADIADSVERIGEGAFGSTALTSIALGGSDVVIKSGAFSACKLTSVVVGGNANISSYAFAYNGDLTSVYFFGNTTFDTNNVFNLTSSDLTIYGYSYNSTLQQYCQNISINFSTLNGFCGDTMIWSLAADGTLTIQGSGAMYDYSSTSSTDAPWKDLAENGLVTKFDIEKWITYESLGITPKYTVVICDGTGDGTGKDVIATYVFLTDGEKVPEPATAPERNGYKFLGWYANGSEYYFGNTVSSDLLITAVWEKPDYVDALNNAVNALNDAVAVKADASELYDAIDDVQTAISKLNGDLKTSQTDYDTLSKAVTALQSAVDTLNAAKNDYATADAVLESRLSTAIKDANDAQDLIINDLKTRLDTAESNIKDLTDNKASKDELNKAVADLKVLINALEAVKDNYVAADTALKNDLQAKIDSANTALTAAEKRIAELESDVKDIKQQIADLEAAKTKLENDLATKASSDDVSKSIDALNSEITKLNTALSDKASQTDYDTLSKAVTALQSAVDTLNAAKNDYVTADEELESRLSTAIKDANDAQDIIINDLKTRLTEAEAEIEKLKTDKADAATMTMAIEKLQKAIDALEAVKNDYKAADEKLEKQLTSAIESAKDAAITAANDALEKAKAELNEAIGKKADASELADAIDTLNDAIATAQKAAQAYADTQDSTLKTTLETAISEAQETLKGLIRDVQTNLDKAIADLNKAISDGDTDLSGKITDLTVALDAAKATFETTDATDKSSLESKIADAQTVLQAAIDKVVSDLANAKAELEAKNSDQDAKDAELQTFITVVCVIACISLAGNIAIVAYAFIVKRKLIH